VEDPILPRGADVRRHAIRRCGTQVAADALDLGQHRRFPSMVSLLS
jgi:hypothetical protein